MRFASRVCLFSALLSLLASPAQAISCSEWGRLGTAQKSATIERMIQNTIAGSGGRQYQVPRGAVGRCLQGYAQSIQYDFDDACADSSTAGMQALNQIFKNYIWTCAG